MCTPTIAVDDLTFGRAYRVICRDESVVSGHFVGFDVERGQPLVVAIVQIGKGLRLLRANEIEVIEECP